MAEVRKVSDDKKEIPKKYVHNNPDPTKIVSRWWEGDPTKLFERVHPLVDAIRAEQSAREKRSIINAQIYESEELANLSIRFLQSNPSNKRANRISMNVVKSGVDTLTSKIGTIKPKPYFLTKKGDWRLRRRAQKASLYVEGCFQIEKAWKKTRRAFKDGCVWGSGFVKVYRHDGRVKYERVLESELIVDQVEGMYGEPRSMHQERFFPREVLLSMFPTLTNEIGAAKNSAGDRVTGSAHTDMVRVVESWHLPSGPDKKDGIRCWTLATVTLFHETWERDYFPFAKFDFSESLLGYFGRGVPDELRGIQLEINKLIRTTALAMHYVSVPQVWLDVVNKGLIHRVSNEVAGVNYYKGRPPIFSTPQAMSAEVYSQIERLYYRGLELIGVSQLSAGGKKPAGVDAKVALRELQDIESERFRDIQEAFEEMHLQLAKMTIDETEVLAKELKKENKELKVRVGSKKEMQEMDWSEVRMDINQYMLQLWPTNLLPSEPAAKFQRVQEMTEAGFFTKEEATVLLDFPDIESITSARTAGRESVMRIISNILDEKEYETPEPFINLDYAKVMAQFSYLDAKNENAPENVLDDLNTLQDDIRHMIKLRDEGKMPGENAASASRVDTESLPTGPTISQAMNPETLTPNLGGLAVPAAPPVSELLPIAN